MKETSHGVGSICIGQINDVPIHITEAIGSVGKIRIIIAAHILSPVVFPIPRKPIPVHFRAKLAQYRSSPGAAACAYQELSSASKSPSGMACRVYTGSGPLLQRLGRRVEALLRAVYIFPHSAPRDCVFTIALARQNELRLRGPNHMRLAILQGRCSPIFRQR